MSHVIREAIVEAPCSAKPSRYDLVNAGLVASLLISGFLVASLLVVWLFGNNLPSVAMPIPLDDGQERVVDEEPFGGEPELGEVVGGANRVELVSLLESVEDAVSQHTASDGATPDGSSSAGTPGPRIPQPLPPEPATAVKRWSVKYEVANREQYQRQLEFFGIEIGVLAMNEDKVWRISNVNSGLNVAKSNRAQEQGSFWFVPLNPTIRGWDRQIAGRSGVELKDKLVVQFYPGELMDRISRLEAKELANRDLEVSQIRKTHVVISGSVDGFFLSISRFDVR